MKKILVDDKIVDAYLRSIKINNKMKKYLIKMVKAGIPLEIHETPGGMCLFGLKWGGSKLARILGFKRKEVIECLNWCDKNSKEALKILGF